MPARRQWDTACEVTPHAFMTATLPPTASITAFDLVTSMRLHFFVGINNFRQHIYADNVSAFYFVVFAVFQAQRYSVYILGGIHMSTLAERVREALTESGLTIAELARRTALSTQPFLFG